MGRALVVRLMGGASVIVCSSLSKCVCVCVCGREKYLMLCVGEIFVQNSISTCT